MKIVILKCPICDQDFEKSKKEYDRQIRRNKDYKFYCSRKCNGKNVVKNLAGDWNSSQANLKHLENQRHVRSAKSFEDSPFKDYIRRCRRRDKNANITAEYIKSIWLAQEGRCAISNIPLQLVGVTKDINVMASLDRIDSSHGYLTGNVQFVSCALNYAKNSSSDDSLRRLLELIKKHA